MKKILTAFVLLSTLVMIVGVYAAPQSSANTQTNQASLDTSVTNTVTNGPIKSVTAITEVFGEGQKVTAVAVEYDQDIDNAKLSPSAFSVEGRTITQVYANTAPAKAAQGANGKYVLIELSPDDANASTLAHSGQGPASRTIRSEIKLAVTQVDEITTTTGETYAAASQAVASDKEINRVVDDFQQLEYQDPKTGITLKYNLYVPKNYDQTKSYPLVLFIHDAGTVSDDSKITLVQGLGGVVWATPSEQAKHESFVLAPQFASPTVNDQSEATPELDATVDLINALTTQYNIDKSRIYTTGQSMGCMSSIALLIKYPDLFAAALLVAGQWDATKVAPLAQDKLWIIVSEGDAKAFPGMNEITSALEKAGAKVSRATWSGLSTPAEFTTEVGKMEAEGNPIKYTALQKGTVVPAGQTDDPGSNHVNTWRIAYTIEGVRDWLFSQVKTPAYKDVAYAGASGTQKLDLYLPAGDGPFPVIINIHGGGFKFGDKGMVDQPLANTLLSSGYAIASLDYRLSGEAIFPAAVLDAKAAVRFLRANAAQYKLNPDKMVAFGQSAGGNIAALLGTSGDVAEFDDPNLGNAGVSSRVQAVINWFGPTDFGQMDAQAQAQGCSAGDQKHSEAGSFESLYLGAAVPTVPELAQQANPITYLSSDDPPFLIQKGDQDCTVPIESTQMLADALAAAGLEVQYDLLPGVGHGDSREAGAAPVFQSQENIQRILNFLTDAQITTSAKNDRVKSVTAITEVFGEGQKITAVAVEYAQEIDNSKLSPSAFAVEGRTITQVYANTAPAKAVQGANGKYVIIELSPDDANASILVQNFGAAPPADGTPNVKGPGGPGGMSITRQEVKVSITQVEAIVTTAGVTYAPSSAVIVNDKVINRVVDDFEQLEYQDPKTGKTLMYNLYIPQDYDQNKSYPLVLFMHDAGATSAEHDRTLIQGLGAVIWATPSEQAKHESFVLAPQFSTQVVNDNSEASEYLDITVDLINALTSQYNIDTNRLYTTGQSGGCMMSIAMLIKYPDLFAAAMLVAGQWDAAKVAPLAQDKLWIIVSEGDLKAFPGMNEITAALEKEGAKVSRATWSGLSTPTEFAAGVSKMMAEDTPIKYVALQKGTVVPAGQTDDGGSNHINTWRIAYTIEGVRDWLFAQSKTTN